MSKLDELIDEFIDEGYSPREAAKMAAATLRAESKLAKREQDLSFPASPQSDGRRVDYGDETPAEARARWEEQERNDPQGIYSGGAESGGIFGAGPIATDTYDPAAMNRTMSVVERQQNMRVQSEMLNTLKQIQEQNNQQLPERPRRRMFGFVGRGEERRLGKKKR
jgi:hypothetical protein